MRSSRRRAVNFNVIYVCQESVTRLQRGDATAALLDRQAKVKITEIMLRERESMCESVCESVCARAHVYISTIACLNHFPSISSHSHTLFRSSSLQQRCTVLLRAQAQLLFHPFHPEMEWLL